MKKRILTLFLAVCMAVSLLAVPAGAANAIDNLFADKAMWAARKADARAFVERERNWQKNIMRYDPVYHFLLGRAKNG